MEVDVGISVDGGADAHEWLHEAELFDGEGLAFVVILIVDSDAIVAREEEACVVVG